MRCRACGAESDFAICGKCFVPLFGDSPSRVSFAFVTKLPNFSSLKHVEVLDVYRSSIAYVDMTEFGQLERLRISHCANLTRVCLKGAPRLRALDLSGNKKLATFEGDGFPALEALDLSFCENLGSFPDVEYPRLEYLSLRKTRVGDLRRAPVLKYLDVSASGVSDWSRVLEFEELEVLVFESMQVKEIELRDLWKVPKLKTLQTDVKVVVFEDCEETSLARLWMPYCDEVRNLQHNPRFSAALPGHEMIGEKFEQLTSSGSWKQAYIQLFGPWPVPPNDKKALMKATTVFQCPFERKDKAAHHVAGAIFGMALGDCLSMHACRDESEYLKFVYEKPLDITWSYPRTTRRDIDHFRAGFTDNSCLMLLYMRSIVAKRGTLDVKDLSKRMKEWAMEGLYEHPGFGVITHHPTIMKVVGATNFTANPIECSHQYWLDSGKTKAGSSALARSVASGCFMFWDEQQVMRNTETFCRMTHYDPRCVYCSVCFAMIISRLVQWRCGTSEKFDLNSAIHDSFAYVQDMSEEERHEVDQFIFADDLNDLDFHTPAFASLQALGCAIWVLKQDLSFTEGIELIGTTKGDTNCNTAAAAAVLGAKWGFSGIPFDLLHYFWFGGIVYRDLFPFLQMMGLTLELPARIEEFDKFHYDT